MDHSIIVQAPAQAVVLGYAPMDDVHAEFADVVARADASDDADFMACLDEVIRHLRSHFRTEDAWMLESDFPPKDCHMQEHAAVLRSADEICALPSERQVDVGRAFVRELAEWFPGHADYLDSALAAWMCKRAHGGKPVVLHRRSKSE